MLARLTRLFPSTQTSSTGHQSSLGRICSVAILSRSTRFIFQAERFISLSSSVDISLLHPSHPRTFLFFSAARTGFSPWPISILRLPRTLSSSLRIFVFLFALPRLAIAKYSEYLKFRSVKSMSSQIISRSMSPQNVLQVSYKQRAPTVCTVSLHIMTRRSPSRNMPSAYLCRLSFVLAATAVAFIVRATASPVTFSALPASTSQCPEGEIQRTPVEMLLMRSIARKRGDTTGVTGKEMRSVVSFRLQLKKQMATDRCMTLESGNFCCKICVSGGRSMFCAHSDFLQGSEAILEDPLLEVQSRASSHVNRNNVYIQEGEVIIDLFASVCDKPMEEEMCSEFVRYVICW